MVVVTSAKKLAYEHGEEGRGFLFSPIFL